MTFDEWWKENYPYISKYVALHIWQLEAEVAKLNARVKQLEGLLNMADDCLSIATMKYSPTAEGE